MENETFYWVDLTQTKSRFPSLVKHYNNRVDVRGRKDVFGPTQAHLARAGGKG